MNQGEGNPYDDGREEEINLIKLLLQQKCFYDTTIRVIFFSMEHFQR